jgi:hypothetical protein
MSDLEKAAVKALCAELVDVILPQVVAAEEAKLPVAYQPLVAAIVAALMPQLQKVLDAKIAAL